MSAYNKGKKFICYRQTGHRPVVLLLLLLLLNFSLLSLSWETFTYPGMCNQQD